MPFLAATGLPARASDAADTTTPRSPRNAATIEAGVAVEGPVSVRPAPLECVRAGRGWYPEFWA